MTSQLAALLLVPALAAPPQEQGAAPAVTLTSLLEELVDRDRLARWPEPAYRTLQASSHDRRSVAPDQPGWFANMDRSWFVRVDERDGRREHVLLDTQGPGALVRFWGTWHGPRGGEFSNGTLRVYLDGAAEPAIEGPIADVLSGGLLAPAPLSQFVAPDCPPANRAHNLYLPIPYAGGCRVTYETDAPIDDGAYEGEALYYQIVHRAYAPGTRVESFSRQRLESAGEAVERASRLLRARAVDPAGITSARELPRTLAPGASEVLELEGPAAIRRIALTLTADDEAQALRSTVLELEFDGEPTVWCPLDAFFGCGYLPQPYSAWYTERRDDGRMEARWVMPFAERARLTLHNLGAQQVTLAGRVEAGPWEFDARSMHFRADWRRYASIRAPGAVWDQGECEDLELLSARGRGVLVGDALAVFNTVDAWWGEGDEKIRVDGEDFPSTFGTGTEDYYGYAWCRPEPFSAPFHAQPTGAGNFHPGYTVNLRQRLLDGIPFERELRFDMELEHWVACELDWTPAVFWYARPGAGDDTPPDPEAAAARVPRERRDITPPLVVAGAIEGEDMEVLSVGGGQVEVQELPQHRWSGDRQLWWRGASAGDVLELGFDAGLEGERVDERQRPVAAELTRAADYGIVALSINGVPAAAPFDGHHRGVTHVRVELGRFPLKPRGNVLRVELTGASPQAAPGNMFGLDHLLVGE